MITAKKQKKRNWLDNALRSDDRVANHGHRKTMQEDGDQRTFEKQVTPGFKQDYS